METPDAPRYRVPDDIAWIDGTEIGMGEELYLSRLPSGDTVQLTGTARMMWHAALEGGDVPGQVGALTGVSPADISRQVTDFLDELAVQGFLAIDNLAKGRQRATRQVDGDGISL